MDEVGAVSFCGPIDLGDTFDAGTGQCSQNGRDARRRPGGGGPEALGDAAEDREAFAGRDQAMRLTFGQLASASSVAWSPDSRRIALVTATGTLAPSELFLIDTMTGSIRQLTIHA